LYQYVFEAVAEVVREHQLVGQVGERRGHHAAVAQRPADHAPHVTTPRHAPFSPCFGIILRNHHYRPINVAAGAQTLHLPWPVIVMASIAARSPIDASDY
jgi:hypothetical protein